jgi:hypothetical protein
LLLQVQSLEGFITARAGNVEDTINSLTARMVPDTARETFKKHKTGNKVREAVSQMAAALEGDFQTQRTEGEDAIEVFVDSLERYI